MTKTQLEEELECYKRWYNNLLNTVKNLTEQVEELQEEVR